MIKNIEKLVTHPVLRGFVRLWGFRCSRFVLYHTIARILIPRKAIRRLAASARRYFARYLEPSESGACRRKAEKFTHHYRKKLCEDIIMLNLDRENIPGVVRTDVGFEGLDHLRRAMEGQRGVLAVGAHVGSVVWGTVALVHCINGQRTARRRVAYICTDPYASRFFPPSENPDTYSFVPNSLEPHQMIRRMLAALNAGQIVTTNLDVMYGGASAQAFRLFEKANVLLPAVVGAAKVAKLSRALVLPWSNRRDEHDRLVLRFEQPLVADGDVEALSQRLRDLLEKWIVESPEQWIYWDRFEKRLLYDEAL